jgi:hypothetical protein
VSAEACASNTRTNRRPTTCNDRGCARSATELNRRIAGSSADGYPAAFTYLQSLIDVIEVDDAQIRIKGSKDVLERAVLASRNGAIPGSQMSTEWRPREVGEANKIKTVGNCLGKNGLIDFQGFSRESPKQSQAHPSLPEPSGTKLDPRPVHVGHQFWQRLELDRILRDCGLSATVQRVVGLGDQDRFNGSLDVTGSLAHKYFPTVRPA